MTADPERIDTRKHDGTTLRQCSHGFPYEELCPACIEEALRREDQERRCDA